MVSILKKRTKSIGLASINVSASIPRTREGDSIAKQLIRSGLSVGANYRAAVRAKSKADFINKLKIVEEESDETVYWTEILEESGMLVSEELFSLRKEANEILAITVATIRTLRNKK